MHGTGDAAASRLGSALRFRTTLPGRQPATADWPAWCDPVVRDRLEATGVRRPWTHQVEAADLVWQGHDTVVATGTASG